MSADWYCKIAGAELGPLSSQQLRALAADGRLRVDDEVCQGQGKWVPAGRVKGLLKDPSAEVLVARPLEEDGAPIANKAAQVRSKQASAEAVPKAKSVPKPPEPPIATVPIAKAATVASVNSATPVGAAVPKAAPAQSPFNFTGPEGHAGASSKGRSPAFPHADAAKQRQKRRKTLLLASIGGLIGLAIVGVVLVVANPFGLGSDDDSGPSAELLAAQQFEEEKLTGDPLADIDPEISGDVAPKTGDAATGEKWLDATKEKAAAGPVNIRVVSVRVDKPRILRSTGRAAAPKEDCLIVTLELVNTDPQKKIVHAGWSRAPAMQRVALNDNHGNPYKLENFRSGTVEGQQSESASLYADDPVSDVLVFERPVDAAEYLRLELPASAVGQPGVLRFQIPKKMIGADPVEQVAAASDKPGDGETGPRAAADEGGEVYQLEAVERAIGMEPAQPDKPLGSHEMLKRDNPELFPD